MTLTTKHGILLTTLEDVPGTFKAPTPATDGVRMSALPEFDFDQEVDEDDSTESGTLTKAADTPGAATSALTIPQRFHGSGDPTIEPPFIRHILASGWRRDETAAGVTNQIKIPISAIQSGARLALGAVVGTGFDTNTFSSANPTVITLGAVHGKTGAGQIYLTEVVGSTPQALPDGWYTCNYDAGAAVTLTDIDGTGNTWTGGRALSAAGFVTQYVELTLTSGIVYIRPRDGDVFEDTMTLIQIPYNNVNAAGGTVVTGHGKLYRPDNKTHIDVVLDGLVTHYNAGGVATAVGSLDALTGTMLLFVSPTTANVVGWGVVVGRDDSSFTWTVQLMSGFVRVGDELISTTLRTNDFTGEDGKFLLSASTTDRAQIVSASAVRGHTLSALYNVDNYERTAAGMRGDITIELPAGSGGTITTTLSGKRAAPAADVSPPANVGYGARVTAPRLAGGVALVNNRKVGIRSLTFSMNGEVQVPPDGNSEDGRGTAYISDRGVAWEFTLETPGATGADLDHAHANGLLLTYGVSVGTVEGNLLSLVSNAGQISELTHSDDTGRYVTALTVLAKKASEIVQLDGDDEAFLGLQ